MNLCFVKGWLTGGDDMVPYIIDTCVITAFWAKIDKLYLRLIFFIRRHLIPYWNRHGDQIRRMHVLLSSGLVGGEVGGWGRSHTGEDTGRVWAPYGNMGQCDKRLGGFAQ